MKSSLDAAHRPKIARIAFALTFVLTAFVAICGAAPSDTSAAAKRIEDAVEAARRDLKIPGCSLAIVLDDQVILAKGFGLRDVANNVPVTPDTRFAIGSCSKAFTAMLGAISADEGKLAFDDSPKKFLAWFKLADAETDANVTLRDMLCHRTGLGSTDLAWVTGTLDRTEVIKVAGSAKPTAPLRKKWQYQNVMYSAAGEAIAAANGSTWEAMIAQRIFGPLKMNNSDTSVAAMRKSPDFSLGYSYDMKTKESHLVPTRDLTNIAPAGAINSSANDMAKWVRFMLDRGQANGKRFVSEKNFNELVTKQIDMGTAGYAMGWAVMMRDGNPVLLHSGGIDGFNSYVVLDPAHKLGYVLLTNVSASTLSANVDGIIRDNLIDKPATAPNTAVAATSQPSVDPKTEAGTYGMIEVVWKDDHLWAIVAHQPEYKLVNVGGRRYKLENAPAGFFATFRDSQLGAPEMFLEQPQGNMTLAKEISPEKEAQAVAKYAGPYKDLIGTYATEGFSARVTVGGDGKLVALVKGQPTYTLVEKEKDVFSIPPAPEKDYEFRIQRNGAGAITGLLVKQPQGDMSLARQQPSDKQAAGSSDIDVDQLIAKVIDAYGGAENLRKHKTLGLKYTADFENQGIHVDGVAQSRAPNQSVRSTTFRALGKTLGTMNEYFDGASGGVTGTFIPATPYDADDIADAKLISNFYGPADWKALFPKITVKSTARIGDEDAYLLELRPAKGQPITHAISKSSFRILRTEHEKSEPGGGGGGGEPVTETFSDWRQIDGVLLAFHSEQKSPSAGHVIVNVTEARFDVDLSAEQFKFPGK